ncbi:MAG TPA: tripartite tricarboxylate transporter substrate binding protein [Syntrophorhabdaceae bacterium]|nr:tripartite tricarboxylate transporter substrate binding protein [Syntrophorhabdaceae bacterium]
MKKSAVSLVVLAAVVCCLAFASTLSAADKYPSRPVTSIVGFGPGGISDMTMRIWNKYLEKYVGGTFVVDHKPGAGGVVAFNFVANSKPDGYTLLNHSDWFTPILNGTATYKLEDLKVVAQVVLNGTVLAVAPDAPWKTFAEFVDHCKKNPGVKWANNGAGTIAFFRTQNLNKQAGLKLTGVPMAGDAEIISALIGKHVQIGNLGAAAAKAQAEAGKLRIIFSFDDPKGFGLDPSIPTMASMFPKIDDIDTPVYLIAPAKTPDDVMNILQAGIEKMTKDPAFLKDEAGINQMVKFVPGKTVMSRIPAKMNIVREIMKDMGLQPK